MAPPSESEILKAAAEVRAAKKGLATRQQWFREAEAKWREMAADRTAASERVEAAWQALSALLKPTPDFGPDADKAAVTTGDES